MIDPLGFALENYDVTGAWRDRDLDAGTLIDAERHGSRAATPVKGPADLSQALLARPDQFVQALTEKLMIYRAGPPAAPPGHADRARHRAAGGRRTTIASRRIVKGIVASDAHSGRDGPAAERIGSERQRSTAQAQ